MKPYKDQLPHNSWHHGTCNTDKLSKISSVYDALQKYLGVGTFLSARDSLRIILEDLDKIYQMRLSTATD